MMQEVVYECDGCGACCRTFPIFASETDAQRESRIQAEGRRLEPHLAQPGWSYQLFPLPFQEACCFLDAQRRCTIYESRPGVCRSFPPGGEQCQQARAAAGLSRLAPLRRSSAGGQEPV